MTIHDVFINDADARLRAGWRILLFIIALMLAEISMVPLVMHLLARFGIVQFELMAMALSYLIVFGVSWGACAMVEKRPLRSVGLGLHDRALTELVQGIVLGTLMITVIFLFTIACGFVSFRFQDLTTGQIASMSSYSIALFTLVAIGEELLFRGYLFQTLVEGTSRVIAVFLFAVFFALVHLGNPDVTAFALVNIALAGIWLSAAYFKTRGLWLPIGLHFSWNFFQSFVFSFPVSGLKMHDTKLGVLYDNGPAWLTGGTFGPEGGALATIVLVAGTLLIWYAPQFRMSAGVWTSEHASDALPLAPIYKDGE